MRKGTLPVLAFLVFAVLVYSRPSRSHTSTSFSVGPSFLPVSLNISGSDISVQGSQNIAFSLGYFSINTRYELTPTDGRGIYLILRDRATGYDHIYEIRTDSDDFTTVVNGKASINVANGQVMVDITSGAIEKVTFEHGSDRIAEHSQPNWLQAAWHKPFARWDAGYRQSWYRYFGLSRWAYSDSTIGQWYGIGFVWFLLRLTLAILLAFFDVFLSAGLLIGQIVFIFFGPTGRDFMYGFVAITSLVLAAIGISSWLDRRPSPTDPSNSRARSPQ